MFDPKDFTAAIDEVAGLFRSLGEGVLFEFGTLGLPVAMNGRGVPAAFIKAMEDPHADAAALRHSKSIISRPAIKSTPPSNHARLRCKTILARELPAALRNLRQLYAGAAGGLPPSHWRPAKVEFVLANGGSVGVRWIIPSLAPNYPGKATIPLPCDKTQFGEISSRLADHARLDLTGDLHLFEIGERRNYGTPFQVMAPDEGLAVARLAILGGFDVRKFVEVRRVHDGESTVAQARMAIEAARNPQAYA